MEQQFLPSPESARAVRCFVRESLSGLAAYDDAVLVASELATNVIRHAHTEFTVELKPANDLVRIEVSDGSSVIPATEELIGSPQGLRIIEAATHRWGVESTDTGKTIWAELPIRG